MPIYRLEAARLGRENLDQWRYSALRSAGLVLLTTAGCAVGLALLDSSDQPPAAKLFAGVWNAVNLVTTLGDFTEFNRHQQPFMLVAMALVIGVVGHCFGQLGGLLSSDAVVALRENRKMARLLEQLRGHVVVIGFGPLGQLVAQRLRATGETVLVVERARPLTEQASGSGYLVVQADAGSDEETLTRLGLEHAKSLVITIENADRKVAVTLMVRSLNPNLPIVVTCANPDRGRLLQCAGATEVVIADGLIAGELVSRIGGK